MGVAVVGEDADGLLAGAVRAGGQELVDVGAAEALVWAGGAVPELDDALRAAPQVRWVQLPLAGVEPYADLIAARADLTWTCAKGIYADSVAEHALALTLALRRGLGEHARAGRWTTDVQVVPLLGSGEVVALLGGGGIAKRLAELLAPFGLHVRVVRRSAAPFPAPHDEAFRTEQLADALRGASLLVVVLPDTPQTRGMVGAEELALLAPGAVVVNIGRGTSLDTDALVAALRSGHLRGAGLDVTEPEPLPDGHPLYDLPGVIVTAHTSNPGPWRRAQLARLVADNVRRWGEGRPLRAQVDPSAGY